MTLKGQLYGSGSPGAADATASRSGILGASISDPMSSANIAPVTNWNGPKTVWNEQRPAAGATAWRRGDRCSEQRRRRSESCPVRSRLRWLPRPRPEPPRRLQRRRPIRSFSRTRKPGNPESEWGIDGAGNSNIEGFATDISVNHGTTVSFKINTDSTNYRIDIYRLGYYGGMGARKVATMQHTGVQNQPAPLARCDDR